ARRPAPSRPVPPPTPRLSPRARSRRGADPSVAALDARLVHHQAGADLAGQRDDATEIHDVLDPAPDLHAGALARHPAGRVDPDRSRAVVQLIDAAAEDADALDHVAFQRHFPIVVTSGLRHEL